MSIENNPGLYIHIPFCGGKCPYCDFYSHTDLSLVPAWLKGLEKEIEFYLDQFSAFDTLYLGGGSPSALSEEEFGALLELLSARFRLEPGSEITIEANPNDLNPGKLKRLHSLGVNRISLGVQSFDDQELNFLGRRHSAAEAATALEWIREAEFSNLGIDLMYGLPGQNIAGWLATLERALTFRPKHLSCYQLTIAKGTPFWVRKEKGKIQPISEAEEEIFFLTTSRFLQERGYIHYEVSNFAREVRYFSRHNQKYWQRVPYLGLGPSAHSFQGNRRWWNVRSVNKYCRLVSEGKPPIEDQEELAPEQVQLEKISLGLRTRAGLDLEMVEGIDREKIKGLVDAGLVMMGGNRLVPTVRGFLVADRLPLQILGK